MKDATDWLQTPPPRIDGPNVPLAGVRPPIRHGGEATALITNLHPCRGGQLTPHNAAISH